MSSRRPTSRPRTSTTARALVRPGTAERGRSTTPSSWPWSSRGLGHSYVGTEHLLLALTAGPTRELARRTLVDMGLKHEQALRRVATALSAYRYARESITFAGISAPIRSALEDIRSRLARVEAGLSPRG